MGKLKSWALLLLALLFHCFTGAQEKQYLFKNIDKTDGLSHNHIQYFLKDSKGFMWIATVEGLCRYDGYSFKVFKNDPADTSSLRDNIITRLFEDHEGKIWVRAGDYLDVFDPETETFTHQQSLFNNRIPVPVGSRWYHLYDHNKNIIYADNKTGLYKYIVSLDSVVHLCFPDKDSTRTITDVDVDKSDNIWIACTNSYMYKFNGTTFDILDSIKLPACLGNYYRFLVDRDDDLWIYDNNNASGTIFCQAKTKELHFLSTGSVRGRLSSDDIRGMVEDDNGMVWIGTDHGGINIVDKSDFSVRIITNDPLNERSLCDNSITRLYKDYQGVIWIGTNKRGISYYHEGQYIFELHKVILENINILGYNDINSFVEDKEGNIWIGSNGGGLIYYNRNNNTFKQYINNPSDPSSISANVIIGLYLDSKDRLWVGIYFGGLNLFDGSKFHHFKNNPSDPSSISDDRVWDICEDADGKLWIATLMGGVNVFDPDKKKVVEHILIRRDTTTRSESVFTVKEGSHNMMWFTTANGLRSYNRDTREFTYYDRRPGDVESLSNNIVYDVYEDSGGFIWAATSNGLNRLDPSTGKFKVFKQEDGLPGNYILGLEEDQNQNLWMCTSNGISRLTMRRDANTDTYKYYFNNFYEQDGLQGNEFNEKAILKTRDGEIFFGGPNGFNIINPDIINTQNLKVSIVFTDFQIFNKSITNKKRFKNRYVLNKSISYTDIIRLKHDENAFTIGFSCLNFIHPERRMYMYRLDNFKNEWFIADSRERKVTYTNLDPGKYVFRVKSTNNDGTWNNEEARMTIIVKPPWWGTLFVKIFSIIFLTSLIVGFYYLRIYQLNQQKKFLEIKVKERTNELSHANIQLQERQREILIQNEQLEKHQNQLEQMVQERTVKLEDAMNKARESDRLKSAFLANMSHEIRTPMNAIVGFSGLLEDVDLTQEERSEFITLIHSNSESLLMLINDILDLSMIEADQMTLLNEPFYLNDLVEQLYSVCFHHNKNPDLQIKLKNAVKSENLKLNTDRYRLNQVISNFMSNACKFTDKGYVELGVNNVDGLLNIYVKDTGIGISPGDRERLFERFTKLGEGKHKIKGGVGLGLAISKSVAEMLGGSLKVGSEPGKGSTFTFSIPLDNIITEEDIRIPKTVKKVTRDWKGKNILVVEDEEANYIYLKKILEKTNATVTWVESGSEAVEINLSGQHFDIILMDIKMPKMDGYQTLEKLRSNHYNHPVIAQTAYALPEDEMKIRNAGFDGYIAKPINPMKLIELLGKYLR